MKIALVHDFLIEYGGAERVLEVLHEIWPEAPVYCAFYDIKKLGPHANRFKDWDIRPSWLQKWWILKKLHSPLRFLTPWVWKYFDFSDYDVVLISSGWYMPRGVALHSGSGHGHSRSEHKPVFICYLHTAPRYLYGYATKMNWQKYWPVKVYGNIINFFLRMFDFKASSAVDYFIANSQETRRRIGKFYRRKAEVIYPPVEAQRVQKTHNSQKISQSENQSVRKSDFSEVLIYRLSGTPSSSEISEPYYLCVSRLAGPKRIDLAIKACNKLKLPLVVVGRGLEEKYLKSIAGLTIKFLGEVSDEELAIVYQNAKALIFPAMEEDFGIVPVEAMGYGKPVIALQSGGAVESIIEGKTGIFFEKPAVEDLVEILSHFDESNYRSEDCKTQAEKFSKEVFIRKIKKFVESKI